MELEKRKRDLASNIQACHYHKKRITEFVAELNSKYEKELISKNYYSKQLNSTFKGRTHEQWINYYDESIMYYQYNLNNCKRDLKKERAKLVQPTIILAVLIIIGAGLFFLGPGITGFAIQDGLDLDSTGFVDVLFNRSLGCERCSPDKAPSFTDVDMIVSATYNGTTTKLIDYYPTEWIMINS